MEFFFAITFIVIGLLGMAFVYLNMQKKSIHTMESVRDAIQEGLSGRTVKLSHIRSPECKKIALEIISKHRQASSLQKEVSYVEVKREISQQVAHDIRSPIAALNAVISTLRATPEREKSLMLNATRRIEEIADNLLKK